MLYKIDSYFNESSKLIGSLGFFEKELIQFIGLILQTKKNKNKILVAGNGGSCADAEHFTGELQCTFKNSNRQPVSAFAITGTAAALTAWGNDFSFHTFFSRQVEAHGNKNDILVLISTGGGSLEGPSSNLVKAAHKAREMDMKIVSFVGKTGGELKHMSDICFHIQNNVTSLIQEAHMSLLHCICENLEDKLKGE